MRILQFLFGSLITFAILGAIIFFGGREVLLFMASNNVQTAILELRQLKKNPFEYVQQCKEKGAISSDNLISQMRLRFTSDHEYQTEVVCDQFPLDPILVKKAQLPILVTKLPGSAGIIYGQEHSGIGLSVLGRKREVFVEQQEVKMGGAGATSYGVSPISTCGGYGYMCCQPETQSGMGDQYSEVNDCPKTCFASCQARPVILTFSSDPFPEGLPRTTHSQVGLPVSFSYYASPAGNPHLLVTIEFGDGQSQEFREASGDASHTYSCAASECVYQAHVVVKDGSGAVAAETPLTYIQVKITP